MVARRPQPLEWIIQPDTWLGSANSGQMRNYYSAVETAPVPAGKACPSR
jgi:hypothetical protein